MGWCTVGKSSRSSYNHGARIPFRQRNIDLASYVLFVLKGSAAVFSYKSWNTPNTSLCLSFSLSFFLFFSLFDPICISTPNELFMWFPSFLSLFLHPSNPSTQLAVTHFNTTPAKTQSLTSTIPIPTQSYIIAFQFPFSCFRFLLFSRLVRFILESLPAKTKVSRMADMLWWRSLPLARLNE